MKKVLRVMVVLGVLATGLLLSGCGGGGQGPSQESIQEQAEKVWRTGEEISRIVDEQFELEPDNPQNWQKIAEKVKDLPYVKNVSVEEHRIVVKYKNGFEEVWFSAPEPKVAVWPRNLLKLPTREAVGKRSAVIILTFKPGEVGYESRKRDLENVRTTLSNANYDPLWVEGENADLQFFKNLYHYGVIVITTHGCKYGIQTGEVISGIDYIIKHFKDWLTRRIFASRGLVDCELVAASKLSQRSKERKITIRPERKVTIRPSFISHYYRRQRFQHALVYMDACESYHPDSRMPQAFLDAGVAGYIGWTDLQRIGASTAAALFGQMAAGKSIREAYEALPASIFVDEFKYKGKYYHSELKWNRPAGDTLQIVEPEAYSPRYSFKATGRYYGHIADIEVVNESNSQIRVYVAGGTILDNPDEFEQDLVVIRKIDFTVAPGSSRIEPVYGCCINLHLSAPSSGRIIFISETQQTDLLALGEAIERVGVSDEIAQEAVWAVTDKKSPSPEDYEEVRNLFIAAGLNPDDYPALTRH